MGPAFTRTFTDAGAIVVTQDHTHADATPHAEYAARNSRGGSIIEADLPQPDDVDAMFSAIDEQFGRLDILVSNYGIVGSIPFDELDDERVHDMFEQNFFLFCRVTRGAVTRMKSQGGGKIVASPDSPGSPAQPHCSPRSSMWCRRRTYRSMAHLVCSDASLGCRAGNSVTAGLARRITRTVAGQRR